MSSENSVFYRFVISEKALKMLSFLKNTFDIVVLNNSTFCIVVAQKWHIKVERILHCTTPF